MPLPLGEVSPQVTERVRTLTESRCTAMGTSLGQSDAIAVFAALTLPASPSQSRIRSPAPPKGEPIAAQGQQVLNLGDALPLPLGEVSPQVTERARTLTESRCTAMDTSLGQSDAIAVFAALTLPASPSQSRIRSPALPKGEPIAAYGQLLLNLGDALAPPLGELASSEAQMTERARTLPERLRGHAVSGEILPYLHLTTRAFQGLSEAGL